MRAQYEKVLNQFFFQNEHFYIKKSLKKEKCIFVSINKALSGLKS